MSRYTRHKLRAHDNGEDRHNKGLMLLKKRSRLVREHQQAVQLAAYRRSKEEREYAAQRAAEKAERRREQEAWAQASAERRAAKAKQLAPVIWHPSSLKRELRLNQRLLPK